MMLNKVKSMKDKYYSIQEVADRLKVAYMTVYRWIRSGKLKAQKAQKQYRIPEISLNQFLDGNKRPAKSSKINSAISTRRNTT